MNSITPLQPPEPAVLLQALRWTHLLNTEEDIEAQWSEFESWLHKSPLHEEAYHLAQRIRCGGNLRYESAVETGFDEEALVNELLPPPRPATFPTGAALWTGLATSTIVVAAVLFVRMYTAQLPWTSYSTSVGQVRTLTLEDGSEVDLDTQSALRARLSLAHRDVELQRGQALFTPRRDWLRPFDVTVNQHVVHAMGTRFLIDRKSDDEFQTLVAEGRVEIYPKENAAATSPSPPQTIAAGQVLTVGPNGTHVDDLSTSQVEQRLAWRHGMIDLNETLAEAVADFNRYNKRKLVIDDADLETLPVAGRYDAHKPDVFADDLVNSHNIYHTSIGAPGSPTGEIHLRGSPPLPQHTRQAQASVSDEAP